MRRLFVKLIVLGVASLFLILMLNVNTDEYAMSVNWETPFEIYPDSKLFFNNTFVSNVDDGEFIVSIEDIHSELPIIPINISENVDPGQKVKLGFYLATPHNIEGGQSFNVSFTYKVKFNGETVEVTHNKLRLNLWNRTMFEKEREYIPDILLENDNVLIIDYEGNMMQNYAMATAISILYYLVLISISAILIIDAFLIPLELRKNRKSAPR